MAELEAQREENNKLISQYEEELAQYQSDQKEEEAYQAVLQEKIDAVQANMEILDTELETIKENIYNTEQEIDDLEVTIAAQEVSIEEGLEQFKARLRAMYVSGSDSLASALVGATDFYDLLSKYELISCVARHDDELVTSLKEELEAYNENLDILTARKLELDEEEKQAEEKREEMQASMDELSSLYEDSIAEQERLAEEEANVNARISTLEEDNATLAAAEEELQAAIERAAAEEQAAREEAERLAAEEAAKATSTTTTTSTEQTTTTTKAELANSELDSTSSSSSSSSSVTTAETTVATTATTASASYSSSSFGWPCPGYYYVSSTYGYRWGSLHKGYDIAQNAGAAVVASQSGTVIAVYSSCSHNYGKSSNCCGNGYGNYVLISHGNSYTTMYAHMASVTVSVGDTVSKGQTIGYVGSTGYSTGFHLHFEIRVNGTAVNPSSYLNY